MKKNKLLTSLLTLAGTASVVTPLVTLTGCNKTENTKLGNLMTEYTPTIKPMAETSFATVEEFIKAYLNACKTNPEIFRQDLMYTLSRGMPQYNAYMSEFCEISKADYNAEISNIDVNPDLFKVEFDMSMHVIFDYSLTKDVELEYYDLDYKIWDVVTDAHFVFDFDTREFDNYDIRGTRRQLTSYAGAAQIGVSEFGSSTKMLKQVGSAVHLDGTVETWDGTEGEGDECHFILPTYEYYMQHKGGDIQTYTKHYEEAWKLWLQYWGMQALVLTFKYYMPSNVVEASDDTPRSLDFGSYHMQNVSLDTTFTTDANTLYGFNLSLDSIKNAKNLETYSGFVGSKLTLPSGGGVTTIADNAFDGAISNYTNLGLPDNVITLDIPSTYLNIGESAFTSSDGLREIIFHRNPNYATNLGQHAFSELKSVSEIDFTDFNPGESGKLAAAEGDKPFETIHLGRTEPGSDGLIYIPALCTQAQEQAWRIKLQELGFILANSTSDGTGWIVQKGRD